jgi:UDP-N-acetylmuramoyl-tripeptide--D-alanyl-D-alanine ligase
MSAGAWTATALAVASWVPAGLRWLRVSQREHYLAGSTSRFAVRWWRCTTVNLVLVLLALAAVIAAFFAPLAGCLAALVALLGPLGLSVRGRTSPLAWTRRLKTLAALSGLLAAAVLVVGALAGAAAGVAALVAIALPMVVDSAAWLLAPLERRLASRFLDDAARRLTSVSPRVVGITGSYGKTSTKNHLVALLGTDLAVVPSPRSFNNRAGLARAVNEQLAPGTEVFIAEMGTYGPGEIAEMVSWCPPEVAVLTAIGPVHLERFGSLDVTLRSKAEIVEGARVVVLNVDDERLADLAAELDGRYDVVRASATDPTADVAVVGEEGSWRVFASGVELASVLAPPGIQASNVACALGAAIALGIDAPAAAGRVASLRAVENRQSVLRAPSGLVVIDDTFNANPAGAAAALALLTSVEASGRRVVVTPGMIELGDQQREENRRFAVRAGEVADVVVVVGRTNATALLDGLAVSSAEVRRVATRDEAVAWVRATLGAGDVVLYENDFPDHYP